MSLKSIILLDAAGKELAQLDLESLNKSGLEAAATPPEIPKTLDWYRETTKWLVAGAAGTLVLGLGFFGETDNQLLRIFFTISGLSLLVVLAAGAASHLWIIEFGKLWENRGQIDLAADIKINEDAQQRYLKRIRRAYTGLLVVFCVGMAAFAIACGSRMWLAQPKKSLTIISRSPTDQLLASDTSSGRTWVAMKNSQGNIIWQLVAPSISSERANSTPAADAAAAKASRRCCRAND